MLVLTRLTDEEVVIGDDITIRILSDHPKGVRLGITAPRDLSIHRREIYDAIKGMEPPNSAAE